MSELLKGRWLTAVPAGPVSVQFMRDSFVKVSKYRLAALASENV
jgi:hypothetical protein